MIFQIIIRTPIWVWALLIFLVGLGFVQTRPRIMGMRRVIVIPAVLTLLSIFGAVSAFGSSPTVILSWIAAATLLAFVVMKIPLHIGNWFDPQTRQLHVLGSWVPLALILGIFANKYYVGIALAMQPGLAQNDTFSLAFTTLYGAFSGIFIGRALRLWYLTKANI